MNDTETKRKGRWQTALDAARAAVDGDPKPTTNGGMRALLVLDEMGPEALYVRARHLRACAQAGSRPVFILGPLSELEHAGLSEICEYLPLAEDIIRATREQPEVVARYLAVRLSGMLAKWGVETCVTAGPRAAEAAAACAAEPDSTSVVFVPDSVGSDRRAG
ncbi:MAG: hypothetical protein AAF914_08295 [Pseudomonadota bacterium]